jgi:hypothetical protein
MQTVALAMTFHESDDRLVSLAEAQLPRLAARYAALIAYCSRETHPALLAAMRRYGAAVHMDSTEAAGIEQLGEIRRETLRAGLLAGTSHLQMCDFDRAIHWSARYPDEMDAVAADIPNYDLLVLGRTERAWTTHPPYQAETEPLFNKAFALVSSLAWDIGAGSRGLSRRAAETLLKTSQEPTVGVDAEWPLLLLRQDDLQLGYRPCEGLEFETADRFGPEIEAAGSYAAWEAQMSADAGRWAFRLRVAQLIAEAAVRYGAGRSAGRPG